MRHENYHALVIDDDKYICEDVKNRLESLGHTCDCVYTQTDAMEKIEEKKYSYILLDLEIPHSYNKPLLIQNGKNLLFKIRDINIESSISTPVIVMSSHGHDDSDLMIEVMSEYKAVYFVKKPFPAPNQNNTLESRIISVLEMLKKPHAQLIAQLPENIFRRNGCTWQVRFNGKKDFTVSDFKGAEYLHHLLSEPFEIFSAAEIISGSTAKQNNSSMTEHEAKSTGLKISAHPPIDIMDTVSDSKSIVSYKSELAKLSIDIEKAKKGHNNIELMQLEDEKDGIIKIIQESLNKGKLKAVKSTRKNIRDAFRNNVNRTIDEIRKTDADLAEHLKEYVFFGNKPAYRPPENISWETDPIKNN